jgi:predicted DNA binding CopG/RHH family protein
MRGRGRPPEGTRIEVRVPSDVLRVIDDEASKRGTTRAHIIRELLIAAVRKFPRPRLPRIR